MLLWILLGIVLVILTGFFIIGYPRINTPRKSGFEGIESPEVVQAYDRISRWPQFRLLRQLVLREIRKCRPEGVMADIGCGPGYLIQLIARAFPALNIIGIDVSAEILKAASDNLNLKNSDGRVKFQQGDIQKLPLEDNSMDFVVSTLSLHHWAEPGRAIVEIQRVLKPGGQFLIFDLRRDPHRFFYWLIYFATNCVVPGALRQVKEPLGSVLASYTPGEANDILSQSKFSKWTVKPGFGWLFLWGQKAEG
jgi:ubiquinone/menaquinone biosynthesis C-methylase UbiE